MKRFLILFSSHFAILLLLVILLIQAEGMQHFEYQKVDYLSKNHINKRLHLLIAGSSRAANTFDPTVISDSNFNYNIGMPGYGMVSVYCQIKILFEQKKIKPQILLLEIDEFSFEGSKNFSKKFKPEGILPYISNKEFSSILSEYENGYLTKAVKIYPLLSNLIFQQPTDHFVFLKRKNFEELNTDSLKGYSPIKKSAKKQSVVKKKKFSMENDDILYFEKIGDLCKRNNIRLVLYRAPILHCENVESTLFDNYISKYCLSNQITFYDFKCYYQNEKFYYNYSHPIDSLSKIITKELVQKMKADSNY